MSASRRRLAASFWDHHSPLDRGEVPWTGQLCQKQPSTKTATRAPPKTRSARRLTPVIGARSTRNLKPRRCSALRRANSGRVSRCRCLFILRNASGDEAGGVPTPSLWRVLEPRELGVVEVGNSPDHLVVVEVVLRIDGRRTVHHRYGRAIVVAVNRDDTESIETFRTRSGANP